MAYYPLSQITPNLYTDGTEYETPSGENYTGFYFRTSRGELFTGRTPQDQPNLRLFPQRQNLEAPTEDFLRRFEIKGAFNPGDVDPDMNPDFLNGPIYIYDEYASFRGYPESTYLPYYSPVAPTEKDYSVGEFRRYFCKKTNQIIYIEIDKDQYDKLISRNPQIYWQMYKPFFLNWQITGNKQQVAQTNKNITELKSKREKLPKLGDYLKHDYIKYYQE